MAIISASAMIRGISLFHMTVAVLLLKNPAIIADQGIVLLLGASMDLPTPRDFNKPSAASAFIAILFALLGLSDLTALSLSEDLFWEFWGNQTPIRLVFLFAVTGYSYFFKEGGMFAPRNPDYLMSAGASLNNSIVFTWGFFELGAWLWVFVTLRDEKREKINKIVEQQKKEEDML